MEQELYMNERMDKIEKMEEDLKRLTKPPPGLSKKGRELRRADMSAADWAKFEAAIQKEWSAWLRHQAVTVVTPEQAAKVDRNLIIGSRFVFTDKNEILRADQPDLDLAAKARLVVRGFEENELGKFRRDAPTGSQLAQHLICQIAASKRWHLESADVEAAYFQGQRMTREVYIRPPKTGLPGVPPGSLLRPNKHIYGFTDAARAWWLQLQGLLLELGAVPSAHEPAVFYLKDDDGKLIGALVAHVDDLLVAFDHDHPKVQTFMKTLKERLAFGSWKRADFVYTGRHFVQDKDFNVEVHMKEYVSSLTPSRITHERRKERDSPLSPTEHGQFRSMLGQAMWATRMLHFGQAFRTSALSSVATKPTVKDLIEMNSCIKALKRDVEQKITFHSDLDLNRVAVLSVSDAAFDNLPNHRSQGGHMLLLADKDILDDHGKQHRVSFVEWRSTRIRRVVRSTLSAEAYSMSEASEGCDWLRTMIAEITNPAYTFRQYEEHMENIPGALVTDAKSLYDVLVAEKTNIHDRRLSLEATLLRETLTRGLVAKWVRSEQMLADVLTKESVDDKYLGQVVSTGLWTLGPDDRAPITRSRTLRTPANRTEAGEA